MASPETTDGVTSLQHLKRRSHTRSSILESPSRPQRRKKRQQVKTQEKFYPIRNIVDEDDTRYLIDWEDDLETGEQFQKTWEPKENATVLAIKDWEDKKARRNVPESHSVVSVAETSQESEPVRTAKRKRNEVTNHSSQRSVSQLLTSPYKRARTAGTVHSARFSYSQEDDTPIHKEEVEDNCDVNDRLDSNTHQLEVVIVFKPNFDREAYTKVPESPFVNTHQLVSIETPPTSPRKNRDDNEVIIPDSQDLELSSSIDSSLPVVERTLDTGSDIDVGEVSAPKLKGHQPSELKRVFVEEATQVPVTDQSTTSSLIEQQNTCQRATQPEGSPPQPSSRAFKYISSKVTRTADPKGTQRSTPAASYDSDDFQFQTQIQQLSGYGISDANGDHLQELTTTREKELAKTTEISCKDDKPFFQQSNRNNAGSSSDEPWQGAQLVPAIDFLESSIAVKKANSQSIQPVRPEVPNQIENFLAEETQDSSNKSVLTPRNINSQTAPSREQFDNHLSGSQSANKSSGEKDLSHIIIPSIEVATSSIDLTNTPLEAYHSPVSPLLLSSSLPQLPETYASNYPPRPSTPSDFDMADEEITASNAMSVAETIKRKREEARVRAAAERSTRSPSVIPPTRASPPQPLPPSSLNQILPSQPEHRVRDDSIEHLVTSVEEEADLGVHSDWIHPALDSLKMPVLRSADHVVLLPIVSMVRDVYEVLIANNRLDIKSVLSDQEVDGTGERLDVLTRQLKLVTDHQDLITDMSSTQGTISDAQQAKWAETSSSKCLFLRELLDALRPHERHIAILARPGRMLDILETIMKANRYLYDRPDKSTRSNSDAFGVVKATLLPTGLGGPQYVVQRADAVIAFDETFRTGEEYSRVLRTDLTEPGKLSPLITLVVTNSAEHIELCLPKNLDPSKKRKSLLRYVWEKRHDVGKPDGYPPPDEAAVTIARFLVSDASQDPLWPLPESLDIEGLHPLTDEQNEQQSGSTTQSRDERQFIASNSSSSIKRPLETETYGEFDTDPTKRMRMTLSAEPTSSEEITRISESVTHLSQAIPVTLEEVHPRHTNIGTLGQSERESIASLLGKVQHLESELERKVTSETLLRTRVRQLESRLDDYASSVRKIQPKYRESVRERGDFETERNVAQAHALTLTQRIEARIADITKLKEEKTALQEELNAMRVSLASSTIPEVAELANAHERVRTLEADNERLEKRVSNMQRDFEFTRDSYQKASSSAVESANELSEMKEEMVELQRKASQNMVRIAEIQRANQNEEREERVRELEALLKDREQELKRKNEELKAKTNGRRETRGTSVPRSPRMGSGAMSPRPQYARPAGGSRANSPSDTVREGFRDAILFPPSGPGAHRWQHLT